jgi:anti-sigma factor RsiW
MSARLDGDLDDRAMRRFDRHVAGCRRCAQVLDSLRRTLGVLREAAAAPAPAHGSVADDVLRRLHMGADGRDGAR